MSSDRLFGTVGSSRITPPPTEMVAQMLKREGKWMLRQERIVYVEVCGGVAGDAMAGVAGAGGFVLFPRLV
jgi:hypothetical protein